MKNITKYHIVLSLVFLLMGKAFPQTDLLLHGFRFIPQSNYNNPAFIPEGKLFIGIPLISSVSNSTYSSSFSLDDILATKAGSDSLYLNLGGLITDSNEDKMLTEYFESDLLYVGFKINNNYLSFGIRNRLFSRVFYADDLVKLLWNGNANYIDEELDLSSTILNQDHFLAYYVNFGFVIREKISIGLRANLNQGLSSIQTQQNNIRITTTSNDQSIFSFNAKTSFLVNTSGLVSDSTSNFNVSNYLFNFQNIGFSVDIGADFKVSDRVNLNFSILDIGRLNWKSGLKSYESNTDSIEFSGIYADINSKGDIFAAYGDSLAALIDINEFEQVFSTSLPSRIYAGLEYYSLDRKNRLSFTFAGTFLRNKFSPAVSFGFEREVSKHFAFKINYSWLQYAPLNLGTGLAFNFKPFQFYFLTDNVFSTFLWDKQKYLNFRFGVNLVFPEKRHIPKGDPVFRTR